MPRSDSAEGSGNSEEQVSGARVIAQALKTQNVEYMFGVVGIPVTEIALAAQELGIRYIGMRNEQARKYLRQLRRHGDYTQEYPMNIFND